MRCAQVKIVKRKCVERRKYSTFNPLKIGDQLSTVTLISPGKKPASSTVILSELLNLVYFLFFYYTILVHFFFVNTSPHKEDVNPVLICCQRPLIGLFFFSLRFVKDAGLRCPQYLLCTLLLAPHQQRLQP